MSLIFKKIFRPCVISRPLQDLDFVLIAIYCIVVSHSLFLTSFFVSASVTVIFC